MAPVPLLRGEVVRAGMMAGGGAAGSRRNAMSLRTFARNAVADFTSTAAVAPSSRHLVRAMVDPLEAGSARVVLEFGPGTGAMTRELLREMPPGSRLLAFEISPRFVAYLRQTIQDERLEVVQAGAATAREELDRRGIDSVDGVLSSLGIGMMGEESADEIFRPVAERLREGAALTQFQYAHRVRFHRGNVEFFHVEALFQRYFRSVESKRVLRNLPPAMAIACRGARRSPAAAPEPLAALGRGYAHG